MCTAVSLGYELLSQAEKQSAKSAAPAGPTFDVLPLCGGRHKLIQLIGRSPCCSLLSGSYSVALFPGGVLSTEHAL